MHRRDFLTASATLGAGCLLQGPAWLRQSFTDTTHPRLYVTAEKTGDLRSVDDVRAAIREGHARTLWTHLRERADADLGAAPLTPASPLPGRTPQSIADRNPDFVVCETVGQRVLRHALVHLLSGRSAYRDAALRQIDTLFDPDAWPQWLDQAHERYGHPAGLRTGMLARDVGLAYDWLYPSLTASERRRLREGLSRYALQPFLTSLEQDPWWVHDLNNWVTTIAGGISVAALALGDAHPAAQSVVDASLPLMDAYLKRYGPEGEYNECPAYANATERPVMFYAALRYASGGGSNPLASWPFPQTCRWTMYLTLPPGRIAALGDSKPHARPWVRHVAAVAAAARDEVLQEFYLRHADPAAADPLELLWYDATVPPRSPQGRVPLGRLFPAQGACFSSRTSWDPDAPACVVYGKASREENHEHNDDGQVCIDGYGERLIVDLGPPTDGYPGDFFDEARWQYYNASVRGHNVLMIGGRERRVPTRTRGERFGPQWASIRGQLLDAHFDDARGGWWQADLTPTYDGARRVLRTTIHLLPGIVVVLDDAALERPEEVSLRWHTADRCAPDADGRFVVRGTRARLAAQVVSLDGDIHFRRGEHGYAPPYDRNRAGELLNQRHESYVEARVHGRRCRLLSLFSVCGPDDTLPEWTAADGAYLCSSPAGSVRVAVDADRLHVENVDRQRQWSVALPAASSEGSP